MMKTFLLRALSLLALLGCLQGCTSLRCADPMKVKPNKVNLTPGQSYEAEVTLYFTFPELDSYYHIVQGAYFNGRELYVALIHGDAPADTVKIAVFDTSGNLLRVSEPLDLDHANNLTYDTARRAFLVTHCQQKEIARWAGYSYVDPETLTVSETGDLPHPFFAMAYAQDKGCYASGQWGGETLDVWDGDLNWLRSFEVEKPQSLSQGAWCDQTGIWFVRSSQQGSGSEIRIYSWETGALLHQIPLQELGGVEPENLTVIGNTLYIVCNRADTHGGRVYAVTLHPAKKPGK